MHETPQIHKSTNPQIHKSTNPKKDNKLFYGAVLAIIAVFVFLFVQETSQISTYYTNEPTGSALFGKYGSSLFPSRTIQLPTRRTTTSPTQPRQNIPPSILPLPPRGTPESDEAFAARYGFVNAVYFSSLEPLRACQTLERKGIAQCRPSNYFQDLLVRQCSAEASALNNAQTTAKSSGSGEAPIDETPLPSPPPDSLPSQATTAELQALGAVIASSTTGGGTTYGNRACVDGGEVLAYYQPTGPQGGFTPLANVIWVRRRTVYEYCGRNVFCSQTGQEPINHDSPVLGVHTVSALRGEIVQGPNRPGFDGSCNNGFEFCSDRFRRCVPRLGCGNGVCDENNRYESGPGTLMAECLQQRLSEAQCFVRGRERAAACPQDCGGTTDPGALSDMSSASIRWNECVNRVLSAYGPSCASSLVDPRNPLGIREQGNFPRHAPQFASDGCVQCVVYGTCEAPTSTSAQTQQPQPSSGPQLTTGTTLTCNIVQSTSAGMTLYCRQTLITQ